MAQKVRLMTGKMMRFDDTQSRQNEKETKLTKKDFTWIGVIYVRMSYCLMLLTFSAACQELAGTGEIDIQDRTSVTLESTDHPRVREILLSLASFFILGTLSAAQCAASVVVTAHSVSLFTRFDRSVSKRIFRSILDSITVRKVRLTCHYRKRTLM